MHCWLAGEVKMVDDWPAGGEMNMYAFCCALLISWGGEGGQ